MTITNLSIQGKKVKKLSINNKTVYLKPDKKILYEGTPFSHQYWTNINLKEKNLDLSTDRIIIYYCDESGNDIASIDFGVLNYHTNSTTDSYSKNIGDYYIEFIVAWYGEIEGEVIETIMFAPENYYINKIEAY